MAQYVRPQDIAPQGDDSQSGRDRREVLLFLVIEDDRGTTKYQTDADEAWTYNNDAYDHLGGLYETPADDASVYYTRR